MLHTSDYKQNENLLK